MPDPYRVPSPRLVSRKVERPALQLGDLVRVHDDETREGVSYEGRFGCVLMVCGGVYLVRFRRGSRLYFRHALTKA